MKRIAKALRHLAYRLDPVNPAVIYAEASKVIRGGWR